MATSSKALRRRYGKPVVVFAVFVLFIFYLNGGTFRSSASSWSSSHKIQHDFGNDDKSFAQTSRQRAVRKEFIHAWTGYQDHGWMSDSLKPLTGTTENQFCGWSATLVDALDTLWIMQLDEEFDEAVNATLSINFDNEGGCIVNLFETTIRHLGGLIAAYDLSGEERLMPQIVELGDLLHSAFNTWNGMPCSHCALVSTPTTLFSPPSSIAMAAQGSLYLEFARLSQITGDAKYMRSVLLLTEAFARTQNDSTIPGLWPELVNPSSVDDEFGRQFSVASFAYSVGALSDSTYEYLVKGHLMLGRVTTQYKSMWVEAAQAIRKYILFRAQIPDNGKDLMFSGIATRYSDVGDVMFEPRTEHLGCFAGGMFGLASRVFDQPSDFVLGEALTNGCVWAYQASPLGLMAETYTALPCPLMDGSTCEFNRSTWQVDKKIPSNCHANDCTGNDNLPEGVVSVSDARYLLRPEAIESVFYYWRMTGNEYWRDVGWEMFTSVRKHTRSSYAHASIEDVMRAPEPFVYGGRAIQRDEMESFWFGETLKYFYLLFSEPSLVSLDEYVLNTEAHAFRLTPGARGA